MCLGDFFARSCPTKTRGELMRQQLFPPGVTIRAEFPMNCFKLTFLPKCLATFISEMFSSRCHKLTAAVKAKPRKSCFTPCGVFAWITYDIERVCVSEFFCSGPFLHIKNRDLFKNLYSCTPSHAPSCLRVGRGDWQQPYQGPIQCPSNECITDSGEMPLGFDYAR